MTKRDKKIELRKLLGGRSILDVALDVYGASVGSMECGFDYTKEQAKLLRMALNCWQSPSSPFDLGVQHLIQLALCEFDKHVMDIRNSAGAETGKVS